jgi:L-serine dehydratase
MHVSVFDLFKIGIGPSSSHTVGPWWRPSTLSRLPARGQLQQTASVTVELFGSLAATGIGHATDTAVLLGLAGHSPDNVPPKPPSSCWTRCTPAASCRCWAHPTRFTTQRQMLLRRKSLPRHPNACAWRRTMRPAACCTKPPTTRWAAALSKMKPACAWAPPGPPLAQPDAAVPYTYRSASQLLSACQAHGLSIDALAWANECAQREPSAVTEGWTASGR